MALEFFGYMDIYFDCGKTENSSLYVFRSYTGRHKASSDKLDFHG